MSGAEPVRPARLSPILTGQPTYPFVRLTEARQAAAARGVDVIDFGIGEPREPTPELVRRALASGIPAMSTYPTAAGLPELRTAIAAWVRRRYETLLDPDSELIPTLGAKEAIFHLAQVIGAPGDLVAVTELGYPVPERGAAFAGRELVRLPIGRAGGWLPDPARDLSARQLDRLAILWVNTPHNPTGAVLSERALRELAALARRHGFVLASDEAYAELWFGAAPPAGALGLADRRNVLAFHTLSKRSSMPGYRSGFVAGDPELIAALKRYRPSVGTGVPDFVQRASIAAWSDEAHVDEVRERYAAKRAVMLEACAAAGLRHVGGDGGFFLWLTLPPGEDSSERYALRLLDERGIAVAPGAYLGAAGEGHVRMALVPTIAECRRAAERLAG